MSCPARRGLIGSRVLMPDAVRSAPEADRLDVWFIPLCIAGGTKVNASEWDVFTLFPRDTTSFAYTPYLVGASTILPHQGAWVHRGQGGADDAGMVPEMGGGHIHRHIQAVAEAGPLVHPSSPENYQVRSEERVDMP